MQSMTARTRVRLTPTPAVELGMAMILILRMMRDWLRWVGNKVKVGRPDPAEDVAAVRSVRKVVGDAWHLRASQLRWKRALAGRWPTLRCQSLLLLERGRAKVTHEPLGHKPRAVLVMGARNRLSGSGGNGVVGARNHIDLGVGAPALGSPTRPGAAPAARRAGRAERYSVSSPRMVFSKMGMRAPSATRSNPLFRKAATAAAVASGPPGCHRGGGP